jgi:zinc protease
MQLKYQCRHIALALCCIFIIPLNSIAQQNKNAALPLDPAVRTGKLANGFTYYIRHNEEPKNRVTFYLANKVGSILESDDQQGLAHFLEHMSFNGTKHFPKNALIDYLQKSGVRFGADINAYTGFDETVYQLPLPSDDAGILKNGMLIMRDWAHGATLDPVEIDKERGVILEEKRLRKGSQERMRQQYWPKLLNGSRYASRLPIGVDEVLTTFKPEAINRYYHDWYRPNLQALIVVGDVDVNAIEKQIKSLFADLKNPVKPKPRVKYTIPLTGKQQFISVTDKEMTATVIQVMSKQKAAGLVTLADYRASIIRQLYNQMLGQRFAELSRQANPVYIQGNAGIDDFMGGLSSFTATVVAKPGQLEQGLKTVWRETQKVKRFGFTQTELDRAKQNYLSSIESAVKEQDKTPSDAFVNEYLQHFLKQTAAPGINKEFKIISDILPDIKLAEVSALSKTYMTTADRDVLLMAPEKDKATLPNQATVSKWLADVEAETITAYQDAENKTALLSAQPIPGKIVSTQKDTRLNLITLTLGNGVKVVLKPTPFKNNEIQFGGFAPGGTSLYGDNDFQSASNAASIIPSFGVGNYDVNQLSKFLSGKQVQVQPYITERMQGISAAAVNKDLETALQLVYARLTQPRLDTALFNGIIARSKASLNNRADNPASVFQDTVSAVLSNYNSRRTGPSISKLEQIDAKRAYAIYKERFADAAGFTFVFTGSIDTGTIKPLIEKYIGSLPATRAGERAKDLNIRIPAGKIEKTVYKGSENKATVRLVFSGDFDFSPANTIQLDALKEALQLRLLERLREDEGGVYSPGVQASAVKLPKGRYTFMVMFGCSPANVEKLIASTLDEISKLKTAGPPQVNSDKFIAEEKRQQELQLKTNDFWQGYLESQLQNNEPLDDYLQFEKHLGSVTPATVKAAANKYLGGENYIRLVLMPEKQ